MSGELEWRWADPHGQQRLVGTTELRGALASGVIAPNTPVWRRGWKEWKPAHDVPELVPPPPVANGSPASVPPPPLFIVAAQHEYEERALPLAPGTEAATNAEPPPPPRYVPSAAPPRSGPTVTVPMRAAPPPPNQPPSNQPPPNPSPSAKPPQVNASPPKAVEAPPVQTKPRVAPPEVTVTPSPRTPSVMPPDSGWDDPSPEPVEVQPAPGPAIPAPRPSETVAGALSPFPHGSDANTAVDISKLSAEDADRLLAGRGSGVATVMGVPVLPQPPVSQPALPPPPPLRASSPVQGAAPARSPTGTPPPLPVRSSNRPPPPLRPRGKTLLIFGGAPNDAAEEPKPESAAPINVPAPTAQAPKAVTQAPPWNEGSASIDPHIPRAPPAPGRYAMGSGAGGEPGGRVQTGGYTPPPMRPPADSIEEISASLFIGDESGADVTLRRQKVEDISSSHVLPDASGSAPQQAVDAGALPALPPLPPGPSSPEGAEAPSTLHALPAPPPVPSAAEGLSVVSPPREEPAPSSVPPVAPASPSRKIVHDLNLVWKQPKQRQVLAAAGGAGAVALITLIVLVARAGRGSRAEETKEAVNALAADPGASSRAGSSAPGAKGGPAAESSTAACVLGGAAHVISPKAQVRVGVETSVGQDRLGLSFATADKDGLGVALDPDSLSALATSHQHLHEPIRRVVPELDGTKVAIACDTDRKSERIAGARTIPGQGGLVFGSSEGQLVWAARAGDAPHPLWLLEGEGAVEALRAVPMDGGGFAVAFRQGATIYVGATGADRTPMGKLQHVDGLGRQVGSPTIAAAGPSVMVVWADRATTNDPWMLRLARWAPASEGASGALSVKDFAIPPGGLGEQAMSPGIAGISGGRFLLAWTEGPVASHQVRAQTLDASGQPLGAPLLISSDGTNAGQGQPAVLPDGRGFVAYLASPSGATAQVVATRVTCAPGAI